MDEEPGDRRGGAAAGGRRVTLHDVAREAEVSYATASRAIHPGNRKVRRAARDRVLAAAAKLNYTPNFPAQAVARGSTNVVALVVSDVADPYFSSLAAGASQAADDAGLSLTMAVSGRDPERELEIVRKLRGQRPRAIVMAGSRLIDSPYRDALADELEMFRRGGGRAVVIGQPDLPVPTIALDDHSAGLRLATALAGRGYGRLALIRGPDNMRTSRDRASGLALGAAAAGIVLAGRDVVEAPFTRDGGYRAASTLVERGLGEIDAVVAVSDVMAVGAMSALRDSGLVPGRDLGVTGFDDIPMATDVTPTLTTAAAPLVAMGARAVLLALDAAAGSRTETVRAEVIIRDSTPPRQRTDGR